MISANELNDRTVLVTGAAQGIGLCIAEYFARANARVMMADVQADRVAREARRLVDEGHDVAAEAVDISDIESVDRMMEGTIRRFGTVDVLVNNAAIDAPPGAAWEIDESHWRQVIDVDLSGPWWCTRAALPFMMEQGSGRVIFISSSSARMGDHDVSVAYNAAKAGLIGLTIGLSVQLEPRGILVNAIAPGPTGTGRITEKWREAYLRDHPLGIVGGDPVAHACLYLAGPAGDWISGTVMNVSGGRIRGT